MNTEQPTFESLLLSLLRGEFSSLTLECNPHACNYISVRGAIDDGLYHEDDWVSEEEKARAVVANRAWVLQWYPDTPVGSIRVAGSSIEAVLVAALGVKG